MRSSFWDCWVFTRSIIVLITLLKYCVFSRRSTQYPISRLSCNYFVQFSRCEFRLQMTDVRFQTPFSAICLSFFQTQRLTETFFSANLQAWRSCYRNLTSDICCLISDFWPLNWWAQEDSNLRPHAYQACALTTWAMSPFGGDNRDRTDDPLLAKQVLSQLSYTPMVWGDK